MSKTSREARLPPAAMAAQKAASLGNACAHEKKFEAAAQHYLRAIAAFPQYAEAYNNLGNVRREQGRLKEAADCYARCISLKPDFAVALSNLGVTEQELGLLDQAALHLRHAVDLTPDNATALFNLGNVFFDQGLYADAKDYFQRAITLEPAHAVAHLNLGNAQRAMHELDEATAHYRRTIELQPDYAMAHHNLGTILLEQDLYAQAAECLQRAVTLNPLYADAHKNLAIANKALGHYEEALDGFNRVFALTPDDADAHVNAAITQLTLGAFEAGWREYEWRWRGKYLSTPNFAAPLWDGSALNGKTILLHCEQGLGDSLQFIRYAPLVKAKGGRVLLTCPQSLKILFASVDGLDGLFDQSEELPPFDCHAPLMSLPLLCGTTTLASIPDVVPYLAPPQERVAQWTTYVQSVPGRKIGLVWAGNPRIDQQDANLVDRRRSMKIEHFAPMASIPNTIFFSLQKGAPSLQSLDAPFPLIDLTDKIDDFADTAALIAHLDLVISVDTSVAHLAGAMGKPVWVLSRYDGCWRWLTNRDDSPWYPTLRLFRQNKPNDWASIVDNLCKMLKA